MKTQGMIIMGSNGGNHTARLSKVFLAALLCLVGVTTVFMYAGSAGAQDAETGPGSDSSDCPEPEEDVMVPGADFQDADCLEDLTTAGTQESGHTDRADWDGLQAEGTSNPSGVPGLQIDGCFPDDSTTNTTAANPNTNNTCEHDSQFVMRFPNDWNGKVVITGAPGVREQYANDFIIGDYVLDKGYAFASTDKGNTGVNFYDDGSEPGGSVMEWHERVEQLTKATKAAAEDNYGKAPEKTYITGISNGGYLTRYALENTPELYDGGVDWEGTLFREEGPNLLTYLPVSLREYPDYLASGNDNDSLAHDKMIEAGFQPGSEFLWDEHYAIYWDLTQRIYREEFDPGYDGPLKAGIPFCQEGTPNCDANYRYDERPERVKEAIEKVSLDGDIGKPLLTLHGDLDTLLPIRTDSDVYTKLVRKAGNGDMHRYYVIGEGNHVDSFYDDNKDKLRPILPCQRDAFEALEGWVQSGEEPPASGYVPKPESGDVVNECDLTETAPRPDLPEEPEEPEEPGGERCTITGTKRDDALRGTNGDDVICGLGGNDAIKGFGANDTIRGGSGNDALYGGDGDDEIIGGKGKDILRGEGGKDRLDARDGARGNDVANGGPGRDRCASDPKDVRRGCP